MSTPGDRSNPPDFGPPGERPRSGASDEPPPHVDMSRKPQFGVRDPTPQRSQVVESPSPPGEQPPAIMPAWYYKSDPGPPPPVPQPLTEDQKQEAWRRLREGVRRADGQPLLTLLQHTQQHQATNLLQPQIRDGSLLAVPEEQGEAGDRSAGTSRSGTPPPGEDWYRKVDRAFRHELFGHGNNTQVGSSTNAGSNGQYQSSQTDPSAYLERRQPQDSEHWPTAEKSRSPSVLQQDPNGRNWWRDQ